MQKENTINRAIDRVRFLSGQLIGATQSIESIAAATDALVELGNLLTYIEGEVAKKEQQIAITKSNERITFPLGVMESRIDEAPVRDEDDYMPILEEIKNDDRVSYPRLSDRTSMSEQNTVLENTTFENTATSIAFGTLAKDLPALNKNMYPNMDASPDLSQQHSKYVGAYLKIKKLFVEQVFGSDNIIAIVRKLKKRYHIKSLSKSPKTAHEIITAALKENERITGEFFSAAVTIDIESSQVLLDEF
jgi:hypothetical protein